MDTCISLFTILAFVFGVPMVALYFKPYRKYALILSFVWILFIIWYYKHDAAADTYTDPVSVEGLQSYDTNRSKKEIDREFYKYFTSLPIEKQQEIIKNLDINETKGFRQ